MLWYIYCVISRNYVVLDMGCFAHYFMNICGMWINILYFYFSFDYFIILEKQCTYTVLHKCFKNKGFKFHYTMCLIQYNRNQVMDLRNVQYKLVRLYSNILYPLKSFNHLRYRYFRGRKNILKEDGTQIKVLKIG